MYIYIILPDLYFTHYTCMKTIRGLFTLQTWTRNNIQVGMLDLRMYIYFFLSTFKELLNTFHQLKNPLYIINCTLER